MDWGAKGIALAASLSMIVQFSIFYGIWSKQNNNNEIVIVLKTFIKILVACIPMTIFLWMAKNQLMIIQFSDFFNNLITFLIVGSIGIAVYLLTATLLHIHEIEESTEKIIRLFKR